MITRRKVKPAKTKFSRVYEMPLGNFTITKGELIKIQGEYGTRFKFHCITTNDETGVQWIDCFEMNKSQVGAMRAFRMDRIKRIPARRGKRRKIVSTTTTN